MLHRHDKCIGIPLFKSNHVYVELWICPPDTAIKEHYHEQQINKIIYLFGKVKFFKRRALSEVEKQINLSWRNTFKSFIIEAYCFHRFENYGSWFVFINYATFYPEFSPISASEDFKPALTK